MATAITSNFLLQRAIRIVPVSNAEVNQAVAAIDNVVTQIEICALNENATAVIPSNWNANGGDDDCQSCDFRRFCPSTAQFRASGTTPSPPQAPG